jgi:hypothetical protein
VIQITTKIFKRADYGNTEKLMAAISCWLEINKFEKRDDYVITVTDKTDIYG